MTNLPTTSPLYGPFDELLGTIDDGDNNLTVTEIDAWIEAMGTTP